jgi:hypothetical protein
MHIYYIYYNFCYKESEEKRMSDLVLPFTPLKIFDLLYSKVGAGAGAASNFCPKPEPHKNDAAPQHCYKQCCASDHHRILCRCDYGDGKKFGSSFQM